MRWTSKSITELSGSDSLGLLHETVEVCIFKRILCSLAARCGSLLVNMLELMLRCCLLIEIRLRLLTHSLY